MIKKSSNTKSNTKSNMKKIREHFNAGGGGGRGSDNFFNIKGTPGGENKAVIRVLPPWSKKAEGFFYYTEAQHFGFTVAGRMRAITCLESLPPEHPNHGKCLVCKVIGKLKSSDETSHNKLADRIRANRRYFINVIDRNNEDEGIKIYGTNKKFIEYILDCDSEDEDSVGDVTDPAKGFDIVITRKGAGLKTRYTYRVRNKSTSVEFDRAAMHQLDVVIPVISSTSQTEELLKANYGDELKEIGMKFGKSKSTKKKKVKEEEVDEEEEDIKEIEDEEEEDIEVDEDEDFEED